MGLRLPTITTRTDGTAPRWGESIGIDPRSDQRLQVLLDLESDVGMRLGADRCVPLGNTHWCIGRTRTDGCIWRIVPRKALAQLHHPAWLWTEDGWFEAMRRTRGPRPEMQTLAHQLAQAKALETRVGQNHRILAHAIAHIRKASGPLAIVFNENQMNRPGQPLRWFALALLTCLPPKLRASLRFSTAEISPDPRQWDVIFTTEKAEGFTTLNYTSAKSHSGDPVATFVLDALDKGYSDRVECLAFMNF